MSPDTIQPLTDLGFTELEARVYLCLLQDSPLTGYAVAKAIGKPTANTYQAIETLARKSAIMVDPGQSRLCRAVPPDELLDALERDFAQRKGRAQAAVEEVRRHHQDQHIYQLHRVDQVFDRAVRMIESAAAIVMLDAFPRPLSRLAEVLVAASAREVLVCVHAYEPTELAGVEVRHTPAQRYALDAWPGTHISLVVDAEQHLYALLREDLSGVRQAVWSESLYLSCMAHNHLALEFDFAHQTQSARSELNRLPIYLVRDRLPGFRKLCATDG